jgi:hypothetical protein
MSSLIEKVSKRFVVGATKNSQKTILELSYLRKSQPSIISYPTMARFFGNVSENYDPDIQYTVE